MNMGPGQQLIMRRESQCPGGSGTLNWDSVMELLWWLYFLLSSYSKANTTLVCYFSRILTLMVICIQLQ